MNRIFSIFFLIFFILCFIVIVWLNNNKHNKNSTREPFIVGAVQNPAGSEGSSGSYQPSILGEELCHDYIENPFGTHITDIYYDTYENNERNEFAKRIQNIRSDLPTVSTETTDVMVDLNASTCNPSTPFSWDTDNSTVKPNDVLWGLVSEQASKSIALKNCLEETMNNFVECSDPTDMGYCYHSPILNITTHDMVTGTSLEFLQNTVLATGQSLAPLQGSMTLSGVANDWNELKESRKRFLSNPREYVKTGITGLKSNLLALGDALTFGLGRKGVELFQKFKSSVVAKAVAARIKFGQNSATIQVLLLRAKAAMQIMMQGVTIGSSLLTAIPGVGVLASLAIRGATYALIAAMQIISFLMGFLPIVLMVIEPILDAILKESTRSGGQCPPGYGPFKRLLNVDDSTYTILQSVVPGISTLDIIDPYVCWKPYERNVGDSAKNFAIDVFSFGLVDTSQSIGESLGDLTSFVKRKVFPKPASYLYDRSLSLLYHHKWVSSTSTNPQTNAATSGSRQPETIIYEPIPTGWERLFNTDNINLPVIAEKCPIGTTANYLSCIPNITRISVTKPILQGCDQNEYDDGSSCWKVTSGTAACSGGIVSIGIRDTYDETTGYLDIQRTPYICGGVETTPPPSSLSKTYIQRINNTTSCQGSGFKLSLESGFPLCYEECPANYTRKGNACVSNVQPIPLRQSRVLEKLIPDAPPPNPSNEPTYLVDTPLHNLPFKWCDFADPIMLDKMASFYNRYSMQNPEITYNACGDMEASIQYISKFYGVVASSELSCDVACMIIFTKYDPISGALISEKIGCSYPDDEEFKDYHFCYRRFYFIYSLEKGQFIVTGCTHVDYTAPDGMVKSYPKEAGKTVAENFLVSLSEPKSRVQGIKKNSQYEGEYISAKTFIDLTQGSATSSGINADQAIKNGKLYSEIAGGLSVNAASLYGGMKAADKAGKLVGKFAGGIAGGIASLVAGAVVGAGIGMGAAEANKRALEALYKSVTDKREAEYTNFVNILKDGNYAYINTKSQYWNINHGTTYEEAEGYTPRFRQNCDGITINAAYCTHKYVIRNMVNKYHELRPGKHIESITEIEPRGEYGCYYKVMEYSYDPITKAKISDSYEKEFVQVNRIKSTETCTFEPIGGSNMFDEEVSIYPIRSVLDIMTNKTVYPFRVTYNVSDLMARFVRIRPPAGSNTLQLTEIEVYDVNGRNVALNREVTSSASEGEYASAQTVVDGNRTPGKSTLNVWKITGDTNAYWQVDLGKNINIAEVIYYGGDLPDSNHIGVRIEFLYSNATNETPILTKTLTANTKQGMSNTVHVIPLYSSSTTKSKYPISGPIKLPPLEALNISSEPKYIGNPQCTQRCEDADVMSRFISQYNNTHDDTQIMRMFRGTNGKDANSCEYEVEMKTLSYSASGSGSGSIDPLKIPFTLQKQYVNMSVNLASSQPSNVVLGRYVRILPNNSPNNVLEISHIVVTNNDGYRISSSKPINCNNEIQILDDIAGASNGSSFVAGDQCVKSVVNGYVKEGTTTPSFNPEYYPNLYIAKNNDASTFFQIDLLSASTINQIMFVGRNDTERVKGGIKGIRVEVYVDDPSSLNARPVFTYSLPTDDVYQTINVWRPIQCTFNLQSSKILEEPVYLNMISSLSTVQNLYRYDTSPEIEGTTQKCKPPQCRTLKISNTEELEELEIPDTYEKIPGVGAVSNIISSLKSSWNSFLPKESEDLVTPITSNLKLANSNLQNVADTVAEMQTISGTDKRCKDREVLTNIMMHYNNLNAPKQDGTISANVTKDAAEKLQQQYGSTKKTMLRILKAGQSTPNTCDIMYEESVDMYDDYIEDIVNKDYAFKQVKAVRFVMNGVVPDSDPKRITDISANALGIMSEKTVVNPPFSSKDISPACVIDCRDPNIIEAVRAKVNSNKYTGSDTLGAYTETYTLKSIKNSFQPSPYVCEYTIIKDGVQKYNTRNASYADPNVETYVRGVFSTDPAPTCTNSVVKIEEYDPEFVTWTNNNYPAKYKGVNSIIPYIYSYNPVDPTKKDPTNLQKNSVRVNSQSQNI